VPTALECPKWETDKTVTPSPHHPFGAKGVGEFSHLGVTHVDIPIVPEKVWQLLRRAGAAE